MHCVFRRPCDIPHYSLLFQYVVLLFNVWWWYSLLNHLFRNQFDFFEIRFYVVFTQYSHNFHICWSALGNRSTEQWFIMFSLAVFLHCFFIASFCSFVFDSFFPCLWSISLQNVVIIWPPVFLLSLLIFFDIHW